MIPTGQAILTLEKRQTNRNPPQVRATPKHKLSIFYPHYTCIKIFHKIKSFT